MWHCLSFELLFIFFFKQKTAYEMRISDWSSDVCSSDLTELQAFSYSVSHDLRAPLRGIDGWSQALQEDCGDQLDATGHEYLQRVRHEAQRMGELIDDLLRLSRVTQIGRASCRERVCQNV